MREDKLEAVVLRTKHIEHIIKYWHESAPDFLEKMGVDLKKLPTKMEFRKIFQDEIMAEKEKKKTFTSIWLTDGEPIGHCNINDIEFGKVAYMHLHMWNSDERGKGAGSVLINQSLTLFFVLFKLEKVYCEPSCYNPAPNKTLEKIGFKFVKSIRKVPSVIASEQDLNQWVMTRERFLGIS